MKLVGRKRTIPVDQNYGQMEKLGQFWNEMEELFPDDFLFGVGTNWTETEFDYYIGKLDEDWRGGSEIVDLPDDNWREFSCNDDEDTQRMYRGIYEQGSLDYEIESMKDGMFITKVHYANNGERAV